MGMNPSQNKTQISAACKFDRPMVTMVLAGERSVCAGGISSSWLMHLKEAVPFSVRVVPKKKNGKKLGEVTGFTFE